MSFGQVTGEGGGRLVRNGDEREETRLVAELQTKHTLCSMEVVPSLPLPFRHTS